ncbi:hypothetical protein NDU88_008976 [Pleurodeles waltl]|uniref:Uncharacterized protein n=1 Tax=Pleurodeles waltl TaxID=8319 RepID=A0AAV7RUS6_PLEWA|nr:hypothetical protein NDU88_008976 [Pleurodeles waltl]
MASRHQKRRIISLERKVRLRRYFNKITIQDKKEDTELRTPSTFTPHSHFMSYKVLAFGQVVVLRVMQLLSKMEYVPAKRRTQA